MKSIIYTKIFHKRPLPLNNFSQRKEHSDAGSTVSRCQRWGCWGPHAKRKLFKAHVQRKKVR